MQCSAVKYSAVHYSAVQYSAVQYSAVQYCGMKYNVGPYLFWPLEAHGICPISADNLGSSIPAVKLQINPLRQNYEKKPKGGRREIGK